MLDGIDQYYVEYRDLALATKLKAAGFPQRYYMNSKSSGYPIKVEDFIYEPTLSELVEACGSEALSFFKRSSQTQWMASKLSTKPITEGGPDSVSIDALGDTLEEAVSNLFIKLNEK